VFENLKAVCAEAGGSLAQLARVGIYLIDLGNFAAVNTVMAEYCTQPYPARSTIGVASLRKARRSRSTRSCCSTKACDGGNRKHRIT